MTTRVHDIIGGYGILVSYMAGSYLIELDSAVGPWGSQGGSPEGIIDEETCTKLIYTDEHDIEPDGQSWTLEPGNTGMKMTIQTATVYDASGDHVLYSMVRDLSFNSLGQLVHASGERAIIIDTTESCP